MLVLMITSQKHDLLWVLQFKSKQKADNLQAILALVNVVTKKQVVEGVDITRVSWSFPDVKESHQVDVLTMDVANDLDWGSNLLDHDWLSSKNLGALVGQFDDVFSLAWEFSTWLDILAFFGLEQWLQEHLAEGIVWILVNFCVVLILRIQFFWFFSQLIY